MKKRNVKIFPSKDQKKILHIFKGESRKVKRQTVMFFAGKNEFDVSKAVFGRAPFNCVVGRA